MRLNYQHLLYFWTVVRAGGLTRASEELRLSAPTISTQLRLLEERLGEKLLTKSGRRLVPARPLRKEANQLAGLSPVVPSSEKVIISARPPMRSQATGPPRPIGASTRLSALLSRLSPNR